MTTSDRSSFTTASIWSQLPNEAHSRDSSNRSPGFNDFSSSPANSTTTTNTSPHSYHPQLDHPSSPRTNNDQYNSPRDRLSSLKPLSHQQYSSNSPDSRTRLSPSPSRLGQQSQTPSIEVDRSSSTTTSQTRGFQQPEQSLQRPPGATRSASFGAYDTSNHSRPSQLNSQGLSATSSPFSPPLPSTNLAPPPPPGNSSSQTPQTSSSSSSTQPLLAEIFSGRPRPHFRSSTSYSHASPSSSSHDQPRTTSSGFNPSSSPTISTQSTEAPSYFAAPNRPPPHHINRARSQSSAPSFDAVNSSDRTSPIGMSSSPYGAPGGGGSGNNGNGMSGLSQSFAADQHGWRPSNQNSSTVGGGGGGGLHFSASLPTTSAVGSPTFSSFTNGAAGRELSSSPSSRAPGAGYSPFARPSSSLAAGPPSNSARPGALLSQSFSTGWEDFEREREGRARVRDTWGVSPSLGGSRDLSNSSTPGLSPFSRDSGRLTEETNQTELSSSLGTGDSTWGMPTGLGPGGVYKARRDYSLGAVGSGRKRSDSAWGGTRERVLREQDEEEDQDGSFAPPTKSGATSRRHSFAAFEAPFGRSSQTIGFHLPEEVHKEVSNGGSGSGLGSGGGFGSMSSTTLSNGLRMGGMGSSAIDDDDLAADLNSLHLSLDAHAKEQQQQGRSSTTSHLHVGSMPVDFPPNRSRRFETSRSPPPSDSKSTLPPPSPSHGMPTLPGSPRATAEPFTPSFIARAAPPVPSVPSGISNSSSVASRFFQAPSPLPPTTTNVIATATPGTGGGGAGSRFDFFGMPNQNQNQGQGQPPQQHFQNQYPNQQQQQQQNRFGLPPPNTQHGFYNPQGQNQGPPPLPHVHRAGPPPSLGSTFSPFAPSPYQSPSLPPPHMMNNQGPPPPQQQQGGSSNYFSSPQQPPSTHLPHSIPPLPASATALTSQSQSDMNLGRGVPLHAIPPDAPLCIIGFKAGRKDLFFCEDPSLNLEEGDLVIVEADRGRDVGKYLKRCSIEEVHKFQQHMVELALGQLANPASMTAMGFGPTNQSSGGGGGGGPGQAGPAQLARMTKECQPKRIYAKAGPADTHALLAKAQDEVKALQLVRGKVAQKGLPMEILDAEWQWDRRKLTFYYTADQRVDFRELVRELFRIWKTRVWLCCLDQQQPGPDFF
ncbi:hypothetical protein JCM5353_009031 [Sporobolomyces roseus]